MIDIWKKIKQGFGIVPFILIGDTVTQNGLTAPCFLFFSVYIVKEKSRKFNNVFSSLWSN